MNITEKRAEQIIKAAYDKGGLASQEDMTEEQVKWTEDNAVDYILQIYGSYSKNIKGIGCYGLNEKGFALGRVGFFSGEEKERKRNRTGINIAIITSVISVIIAILALIYKD